MASSFTSSPILDQCFADPYAIKAIYLRDDKQAMTTIAGKMPEPMLHSFTSCTSGSEMLLQPGKQFAAGCCLKTCRTL